MPVRLVASLAAAALALGACSGYVRRGSAPSPETPQSYGDGIDVVDPGLSGGGESGGARAIMVIRVVDDATGEPLPGATVRHLQGEEEVGRANTDSKGRARIEAEPGSYLLKVTGCGSTVLVDRATEAVATVPAGGSFAGDLRALAWKRRFHPTNQVRVLDPPPWQEGRRARVEVRIEDRCTFGEGRRASIAAFRWRTTGAVALAADPPTRAGANGWARVIVACRRSGNGRVIVSDPHDPADSFDLLAAASAPPDGKPWCA